MTKSNSMGGSVYKTQFLFDTLNLNIEAEEESNLG